jgi:hypothetical protein
MVEIIWQDPPTEDRSKAGLVVEQLKKFPGRWARVATGMKSSAGSVAFKNKGCEAVSRRAADLKTWDVFARWPVGKDYPAWTGEGATVSARPAPGPEKTVVDKAISSGTALTPPPAVLPKKAAAPPANDFGITAFNEARRARGALPNTK